jgi:hypothetical protein
MAPPSLDDAVIIALLLEYRTKFPSAWKTASPLTRSVCLPSG